MPYIRNAIHQFAQDIYLKPDVVDATTCYTLQELYYRGHVAAAQSALELLQAEPSEALKFIWTIRRLIVDPELAAPGIPHALEVDEYRGPVMRASKAMKLHNISLASDVGAVVAQHSSFPTPVDWDGLKWCEDNLDLKAIRTAFTIMEKEALSLSEKGNVGEALRNALSDAWQQKAKSVGKIKSRVLWGTSLSLAVTGTFVTEPIIGILAALGMTAASNVWLEQASKAVSKLVNPQAFHLWDTQRRYGRLR